MRVGARDETSVKRREIPRSIKRPYVHVVNFQHAGYVGFDVPGDAVAIEIAGTPSSSRWPDSLMSAEAL